MQALATALGAVVPTFLLIGVGALADRLLPNLRLDTLTRLSVYVLMPALVFDVLATTELAFDQASRLTLAYLLYLVLTGLLALAAGHGLGGLARRTLVACSLFGNTGNMGLPVTLFAYGAAGLDRAVVIMVASTVMMFAFGPPLLAASGDRWGVRLRQALLLPPIWAALLGVGANVAGVGAPLVIERSVGLLGAGAIPLMLLSLGIQVRRSWVWSISGNALRATAVRLVAGPFLAAMAAATLALPELDRNVLVLSATMPVAVTMFVVAAEVRGDHPSVARTVVAMTVASVIAITVALALLAPT